MNQQLNQARHPQYYGYISGMSVIWKYSLTDYMQRLQMMIWPHPLFPQSEESGDGDLTALLHHSQ